jgi:hypothetical protein
MEKYEQNTSNSLEIEEQKDVPISVASSSDTKQWTKNFSNRWNTKQYTKKELIGTLNDVKQTQLIASSNLSSLTSRITKVEDTLNNLIAYINQRIP